MKEKKLNWNIMETNIGKSKEYKICCIFAKCVLLFIFCFLLSPVYASETMENNTEKQAQEESENKENSGNLLLKIVFWPFEALLQPLAEVMIYPFSEPLRYAFQNGVVEKAVDLITFGENKNIFIYPVMNLKPGTSTMLGFMYRHSFLLFPNDYFVLSGELYANSDTYYSVRYSQKRLFDGNTYVSLQHKGNFNRDGNIRLLGSDDAYYLPDTTLRFDLIVAHPLPFPNTSVDFSTGINMRYFGLPEMREDWVEFEDIDKLEERGLYQDFKIFPQSLTVVFDNTESPYVPSSGFRIQGRASYNFVTDYSNLPSDDWDFFTSEKNHDYWSLEFLFQTYFYLGKDSKQYLLSKKEAREKRKEYADFSLNHLARLWNPSKLNSLLLERRVLALQYRYLRYFEMEKGGMPAISFPRLNDRFPLRGYENTWAALAITGLSLEYRWPIDYYIDGVLFSECAVFADEKGDFQWDNFKHSWGMGIRVRRPDMYFFRFQLGFHGFHGIHLVMTIAPEFQ